ncbi:MAG: hypothetical protein JSS27_01015 [Planctomycetes bacterium]|nr:hypothetical protein [Planctomycetota bacterium]
MTERFAFLQMEKSQVVDLVDHLSIALLTLGILEDSPAVRIVRNQLRAAGRKLIDPDNWLVA